MTVSAGKRIGLRYFSVVAGLAKAQIVLRLRSQLRLIANDGVVGEVEYSSIRLRGGSDA